MSYSEFNNQLHFNEDEPQDVEFAQPHKTPTASKKRTRKSKSHRKRDINDDEMFEGGCRLEETKTSKRAISSPRSTKIKGNMGTRPTSFNNKAGLKLIKGLSKGEKFEIVLEPEDEIEAIDHPADIYFRR